MMKRNISISKSFDAIRQLPLEVPFSKVEEWVRQQPFPKEDWKQRLLMKFWNGNQNN